MVSYSDKIYNVSSSRYLKSFLNSNVKELFSGFNDKIVNNQNSRFQINYSFEYTLKNTETGVLQFYHPSFNSNCVLKTAK